MRDRSKTSERAVSGQELEWPGKTERDLWPAQHVGQCHKNVQGWLCECPWPGCSSVVGHKVDDVHETKPERPKQEWACIFVKWHEDVQNEIEMSGKC